MEKDDDFFDDEITTSEGKRRNKKQDTKYELESIKEMLSQLKRQASKKEKPILPKFVIGVEGE